jgi:hypothetical protein
MDRAKHGRFPHRYEKIQFTKENLAEVAKISATEHEDQESKVKEKERESRLAYPPRESVMGCRNTEHQAS